MSTWNETMEYVPNFSEGWDLEEIDKIITPFRAKADVKLLDYSNDEDHNRLVVTAVGEPVASKQTILEAIGVAVGLIDLNKHSGQHPRMGAVDVVPFIPIRGCTMKEAITLSKEVGEEVGIRYAVPVFLYEKSASAPYRESLATIRKGEFEEMTGKIHQPGWKPDFSPAERHPTAGTVAIGAHTPLVAYNVDLGTNQLHIATDIMRKIRFISGGLCYCKAMGVELKKRSIIQVSVNMTDYTRTALYQTFELVRIEARKYGVPMMRGKIIGLVPMEVLIDTASYYLGLEDFSMNQILKVRIMGQRMENSKILIRNAAQTVTCHGDKARQGAEMSDLGIIEGEAVAMSDGVITHVGPTGEILRNIHAEDYLEIRTKNQAVLPGFVDSHTCFIFSGYREEEFSQRLRGNSYMSVMERGGGIVSTMKTTRESDLDTLWDRGEERLDELFSMGVTTAERKSGYGLDLQTKLIQFRVISDLNKSHSMDVVSTFLGTHAVPPELAGRTDDYVDYMIEEVLPAIRAEHTVTFCDVFCEKGIFPLEQNERLLRAVRHHRFKLKMHADGVVPFGGAELATSLKYVSADHLLHISNTGTKRLARAGVVATLPPLAAFSLNEPYVPARKMIDAGCAVALTPDLNSESCFSASIPMMIALACICMKVTPEEAVTALTISGTATVGRASETRSISMGKRADVILLKYPSYKFLPYRVGMNLVDTVVKDGELCMT